MKVIPPSGLQKIGKTLGKASGFTAFCNPRVESPYISWLLMKESYNLTCHVMLSYICITSQLDRLCTVRLQNNNNDSVMK